MGCNACDGSGGGGGGGSGGSGLMLLIQRCGLRLPPRCFSVVVCLCACLSSYSLASRREKRETERGGRGGGRKKN